MFRIQPVVRLPRAFAPIKEFRQDGRIGLPAIGRCNRGNSCSYPGFTATDILLLSGPALVAEAASVIVASDRRSGRGLRY